MPPSRAVRGRSDAHDAGHRRSSAGHAGGHRRRPEERFRDGGRARPAGRQARSPAGRRSGGALGDQQGRPVHRDPAARALPRQRGGHAPPLRAALQRRRPRAPVRAQLLAPRAPPAILLRSHRGRAHDPGGDGREQGRPAPPGAGRERGGRSVRRRLAGAGVGAAVRQGAAVKAALTLYGIAVTAAMYALSRRLSRRWPSPFTSPVFFTTCATIVVFLLTRVELSDYAQAREILTFLLGPATVALAMPLYRNRRLLVANLVPAMAGLMAGALGTMVTAVALAKALGLSHAIVVSISIKSVTAPVAVEIARMIHADQTLTAAFVIVTGMIGVMLGPWLLDRAGIRSPLARGLALGTISHGQGTAQAALESELAGAIASIALGVAAVLTSLVAPLLLPYL